MTGSLEMDPKVAQALAQALGHAPPFGEDELAALDTAVHVTGARDISGLAGCQRIRALQLHACEIANLAVVAHLPRLESLRVTCSTVADIAALAECRALTDLELAFDLIEDARPIQSLSNLRRLTVLGNPLDEHSFHEVMVPLRDSRLHKRGSRLVVEIPTQYDWSLTRELIDAGVAAVFDAYDESSYLVRPGLTLSQGDDAEVLQVPSSHVVNALTLWDIQEESLEWLYGELFDSKIPRVAFPRQRRYIVGDALDAKEWIAGSSLPEEIRRALLLLVQRFPDIQYARLTRAHIEEWQSNNAVALPEWLVDILAVLPDMVPGQLSSVRFDGFDRWSSTVESLDHAWYQLGLTTPMGDYRTVVDRNGYLAIGIWLETVRSNLAINIRDPEDRRIYEFCIEDVGEAGLLENPRVVFDSYASMISHIRSIQIGGAVSDPPAECVVERTSSV